MVYHEICLIPARGGSKGIRRKNLARVGNNSLLDRTILAAKNANVFGTIIVSSEDNEILDQAKLMGVSTITRSIRAALDDSTAADVVNDFLNSKFAQEALVSQIRLTYLQPTSPFRNSEHILSALKVADKHISGSCVSVCLVKSHPNKMVNISESTIDSAIELSSSIAKNRQSLPKLYIPNGAIYVFPLKRFVEVKDFPVIGSGFLKMNEKSSIDIDTEFDLILANILES
jgi:CMP-N-acetylneuraminic acid synthetase